MSKQVVHIDWNYKGKEDFASGTGATKWEQTLTHISMITVPLFLIIYGLKISIDWNLIQWAVALILAVDIGGGVVSNSLNSYKRFYHTPAKPHDNGITKFVKNRKIFALLHIHTILISLLYHHSTFWGIFWYVLLNLSVWFIESRPLYLHRPVAMGVIMIAILVNTYIIVPPTMFEWLIPFMFIKIVYGHSVKEEPYRKTHL